MASVKPSNPDPPPRRQRARATRLRIAGAAAALFRERGYTRTTMADIAAAAGVAVQTVYFVFHTKTEVLDSAYGLAVMGEDEPAVPQDQPWYRQAVVEPDVAVAVRLVVEGVSEILRRVAPLDHAVRAAAAADPEAAAFLARNEGMRADGYREMLGFLVVKRPLREGLTQERAVDVLLFLASPGAYRALVIERGWSHAEWVAWTSGALCQALFAPGADQPSGVAAPLATPHLAPAGASSAGRRRPTRRDDR
ncbi:MAG: TetR family transcriptional regulator [Chloroflexota bacterium]